MKYFKNVKSEIYAYEDDVNDEVISQRIKELGLIALSKKELEELNKPKEISLEDLKLVKLNELSDWVVKMADKSVINLKGFGMIDGGYKYLLNARAMKNNFELLPQKVFRMYDNSFKKITATDLTKIETAIELGGIMLHTLKWQYESAIGKAKSKEDLENISFNEVIEINLDKDNK
nr:MAG TPA: hypothetical protein [Caudoviricetes sp.]